MARRIAFLNEKGGSCKTTLTVNVGSYLSIFRRRRVLLIDLDSQGQVGKSLGLEVRTAERTTLELLQSPRDAAASIVPTRIPGLDVVPSNRRLAEFPVRIAPEADRAWRLSQAVEMLEAYDFILFDSPPSQGLITQNILLATQEVVVPVNLTYLALDGCAEIMETIRRLHEEYDRTEPAVSLVVPTLYRNTNLANEILTKLRGHFQRRLARSVLALNVKIDEAQSHGLTIWEYAPSSAGAEMLEGIAREIERSRPD